MILAGGITAAVSIGIAHQKREDVDMALRWNSIDLNESYGTPNVRKLEIEMGVGEMEIVTGSEYAITAKAVPDSFVSVIDGDTWKISQADDEKWDVFSLGIDFNSTPRVVVTVPQNCTLESVSLENCVGELQVEQLVTENLRIDCGTGKVSFCGQVSGDVEIECGVGEVNMELLNAEADFHGAVSCGVGNVTLGSHGYSGLGHEADFGSGQQQMSIDCGIGSVNVTFHGDAAASVLAVTGHPTEEHTEDSTLHVEDHTEEMTDHADGHGEENDNYESEYYTEGGEIHGF